MNQNEYREPARRRSSPLRDRRLWAAMKVPRDFDDLPDDIRQVLGRYRLQVEADLHSLDSEFQQRFARASDLETQLALLTVYAVERFDRLAYLCKFMAASKVPSAIGATYEPFLESARQKALDFIGNVLASDPKNRDEVKSTVALELLSHKLEWLAHVKTQHVERSSKHADTKRSVTPAIIARRRQTIRDFCRREGLSANGFARRVCMSESAVRGVVKEDRRRYSEETQARLVKGLGLSVDQWYQP